MAAVWHAPVGAPQIIIRPVYPAPAGADGVRSRAPSPYCVDPSRTSEASTSSRDRAAGASDARRRSPARNVRPRIRPLLTGRASVRRRAGVPDLALQAAAKARSPTGQSRLMEGLHARCLQALTVVRRAACGATRHWYGLALDGGAASIGGGRTGHIAGGGRHEGRDKGAISELWAARCIKVVAPMASVRSLATAVVAHGARGNRVHSGPGRCVLGCPRSGQRSQRRLGAFHFALPLSPTECQTLLPTLTMLPPFLSCHLGG